MPEIKWQIRVIKERLRSIKNTLPYHLLPSCMILYMVSYVFLSLNGLTVGSGISDTLSPRTIMIGTTIEFNNYCQLEFGAYAKTHEHPKPLNSQKTKGQRGICLCPTGNI